MSIFEVDPDILKARTLASEFYTDDRWFELSKEKIFARSWQLVAGPELDADLTPVTLLPGFLDEPLLISKHGGDLKCLSNVCTHRGKILVDEPSTASLIRCSYHGRRFSLDGKLLSMPEFDGVEDFPSESDNLKPVAFAERAGFKFASLDPAAPFEDFVNERIIKPFSFPTIRFKHQEDVVPDRATGYVLQNDVWKNGEPLRPKIIAPSGGVLASAVDLARWWEAVLQGRVVKPASLEQMLKPAKLNDGRSVSHGFAFFTNTFNGNKFTFHAGSTVGGFGSMVYYFPKDKLTVAIIGNLEDGGFGAEYIAKRVFNFYIPGTYVGGLKVVVDVNKTQNALQILKDLADGKSPESLSANFASRMPEAFRKQLGENLKQMKAFAYIGNEKIGENHFMLDAAASEFFRYKMTLANKTVYYHFRMNGDGKIRWIIFEE